MEIAEEGENRIVEGFLVASVLSTHVIKSLYMAYREVLVLV